MNRRTIRILLAVAAIALAAIAAATGFTAAARAQSTSSFDQRSTNLAAAASLVTDPFATETAAPAARAAVVLPAPTGRSAVATFSRHWTDASRPDPFVAHKRRELMVQFWCPSGHMSGSRPARYLPARTARVFERFLGISSPVFDGIGVHARTGGRVASGRHPVILFSPGFGTTRAIYTALLEDLASHGFVVVAIDHPYDAGVVEFPDGRLERQRFPETPAATNRALSIRVADVRFVLDRLSQLNAHGALAGKLDLQHVGVFGHSLGGATAAEVMRRDARVDAGANLDGSFRQTAERGGVAGPFMLITAPRGVGPSEQAYRAELRRSQLRLTLRGADHYAFTDFAVTLTTLERLAPGLRDKLPVGSIDGPRALAIERRYLGAFFRAHLRGTREPLLTRASAAYPDVSFERGTH